MTSILAGNPSQKLLGRELDGGWTVDSIVPIGNSTSNGTGGNFTSAYTVVGPNGERAFLKALDYSKAMLAPNTSLALQAMSSAYLFECEVLEKCNKKNLDRVIRILGKGKVEVDEGDTQGPVEYIIFEMADGDVRKHLKSFVARFDMAWELRSLHHIATGLEQLHKADIAHQDLKPSNVLVVNGTTSKLADLGRAAHRGHAVDHDEYMIAGDPTYAPIDLAYGYVLPDWNMRRLSCDAYHLGSMVVFFFTGVSMTTLVLKHLDYGFQPAHLGGGWAGNFEDVLEYVKHAFEEAIKEFAAEIPNDSLKSALTMLVKQLCEPDVALRGHPLNRRKEGNSFSLERYISTFDLLATRAEIGMFQEK